MKCRLVNPVIKKDFGAELLRARGVADVEQFLNPQADCLQTYRDLDNIEAGCALLLDTIEKSGDILIIVDSDTDGITSGAIMYTYINQLIELMDTNSTLSYLLHSKKQHGLQDHIDNILTSDNHYDLVIQPDSGSNDKKYHDQLAEIGTKVLVLDHHITDIELSDNAVVINNQLSTNYHNKDLTGAGVTWQFCRALDDELDLHWADDLVDLAALGIIADMGSMMDLENRYIVFAGLHHITNYMFRTLLERQAYSITGTAGASFSDVVEKTNPISVAFYIVPLINAMIRVGLPEEKERLFLAFIDGQREVVSHKRGAKGALERLAIESTRECVNAKAKQKRIQDAATESLEVKIFKYDLLENKILFVRLDDDDDFPSELNGLIAMRLAAKFKKPTIVARLNSEGYDRGSMRGLNQSELTSFKDFLEGSNLFEWVTGHPNAAGVSIADANLSEFHKYANEALKDVDFGESFYDVNFEMIGADPSIEDLVRDLDHYQNAWGQNCPEPLVYVKDINITEKDIQIIGEFKDTVKFTKSGVTYIKFHASDFIEELQSYPNLQIEVVGRTSVNRWRDYETPQIIVDNYEIKNGTLSF